MHYSCIFFKKMHKRINHALIFCAFGLKRQVIGNFEKISENFENSSSENCKKCIILAYFSNKLTNYSFIFCAFGRKHKLLGNLEKILKFFDKNSFEKLNYLFIFFRKFVTKNRAFGNNTIFLRHFFGFGGGGFPPFPPGYSIEVGYIIDWSFYIYTDYFLQIVKQSVSRIL